MPRTFFVDNKMMNFAKKSKAWFSLNTKALNSCAY